MNTSTDQTAMDLPSCMVGIESMVGSSRDLLCPRSCLKSRHGTSAVTCPRSALAQDRVQRRRGASTHNLWAARGEHPMDNTQGQRCRTALWSTHLWGSVGAQGCVTTCRAHWACLLPKLPCTRLCTPHPAQSATPSGSHPAPPHLDILGVCGGARHHIWLSDLISQSRLFNRVPLTSDSLALSVE